MKNCIDLTRSLILVLFLTVALSACGSGGGGGGEVQPEEQISPLQQTSCYPTLPAPKLVVTGTEDYTASGQAMTRYLLDVNNTVSFPDELFAAAPNLSPCGINTNSSRTWVNIYDNNNSLIGSFCGFTASSDLNSAWFAVPQGSTPPSSVYIELNDRECNNRYTSNLAPTTLESITVTPANPGVTAGKTVQFIATGHYSNGTSLILTDNVDWSSTRPNDISISNTTGTKGLATVTTVISSAIAATDTATGIIGSTTVKDTAGYFLDLGAVSLNGSGSSITVSAGASVTVTSNYWIWSRVGCPGCIDWIAFGIEGDGQDAHYVGMPGASPGETGTASTMLTVPAAGVYTVYGALAPNYTMSEAIVSYETNFSDPDVGHYVPVGTIVVQ